MNVQIALKPKRPYSDIHDSAYTRLVNELHLQREIILLAPGSDLYLEISRVDLVLAPPFSSPTVVAKESGIPSLFYMLSDSSWKLPNSHHGIKVVTSLADLMSISTNLMR